MNGGQAAAMAVAGVVFNWQILPRIGGKALWRGADHAKGYPLGILLYPLSVLGLTLWFWSSLWMAAAIWGVLAVGDGMASVVGQAAGGPPLPWNDRKSWPGFVAFVGFGTLAAAVLIAWTAGLPLDLASSHAGRTVGAAAAGAGHRIEAARGIAEERAGVRGWRHAGANGGVPAFIALLAGLAAVPLRDLLVLAYAGAVATAAADTCSSEVGKAYGRRTFLITSLRAVPPGTEGAISLEGTLGGLLGALMVAWGGGGARGHSLALAALS